jgi:hypothetical protein
MRHEWVNDYEDMCWCVNCGLLKNTRNVDEECHNNYHHAPQQPKEPQP